ncbi:aspartate--tRNA ligase [Christensenellaceae bacterium NSJ-44]|uniref:Aspartate--tRNA ligase n=1 Tax=Luoshenia tenuis TaxID=2763654 RepID=A0A926HMX0_9FIRM|nr:aspartate--tRNA ligase [Luoshenia tenuis]MBC8529040.1 aspartate--tRNA ligase [Luoshenia tenuis]
METSLSGWKRSCYCAQVEESRAGQEVTLMGWVQRRRNLGGLIFVWLRDRSGIVQLVFDSAQDAALQEQAETIRHEDVLAVKGIVVRRQEKDINKELATGAIEIAVKELKVLSRSENLPFNLDEDTDKVSDALRLKYRYLDLRRPQMQSTFMLRHRVAQLARRYFDEQGFLELETPMLTKSTPEGARDYLVPSRVHPGTFYALPQSPQQFKQLLMLSGFDKYIQIVRCFRDEDLRADRQPEFTQIDLEMSFVEEEDVMQVNEGFVQLVCKEVLGMDLPLPLQRLPYAQAMARFGSDKPDTRFGMELQDLSGAVQGCGFKVFADALAGGGSVRAIVLEGQSLARKELDRLGELVKTYHAKGLAWAVLGQDGVRSPIAKFFSEEQFASVCQAAGAKTGDTLLMVADASDTTVCTALGQLRLELGRRFGLIDESKFNFLWVTEFPLLEWDEEAGRFSAMHHPFTMPMDEDIALLETDPGRVRAKAYDMVLNGTELGGGSIRIHDSALQEKMFGVLGFTKEQAWNQFGYLLEAFKYGTPPHGGMAYGFDRLVMLLSGKDSIRDVIAFPKVQNASCPLTEAPCAVDDKQLRELGLKLDLPEGGEE